MAQQSVKYSKVKKGEATLIRLSPEAKRFAEGRARGQGVSLAAYLEGLIRNVMEAVA